MKTTTNPVAAALQFMDGHDVIALLKAEREKYSRKDKNVMQRCVDELVRRGHYPKSTPTMEKYGYTHLSMVEGYGVDWCIYREPLNCPKCNADFRNLESGPPFKREIGIEITEKYDGVDHFQCPDCGHEFGHRYHGVPIKLETQSSSR